MDTARFISELANLNMDESMPYVGRNAFAHKGGMHIDGVLKRRDSFEHIDPKLVGNRRRLLISEVAGRSALLDAAVKGRPGADPRKRGHHPHPRKHQGAGGGGLFL